MGVGPRYTFVIPLENKSQVVQAMVVAFQYPKSIRKGKTPWILSDNALEFVSNSIVETVRQLGAATSTTVPINLQENGLAERMGQKIMEGVRCALQTGHM